MERKSIEISKAGGKLDRREALIEAAERRISAEGHSSLRARDLAADAGCALGAIYLAFEDLDAVIEAVRERTLKRLEQSAMQAARPKEDALTALKALARLYFTFARENPNLWRALFEHRSTRDVSAEVRLAQIFALVEDAVTSLRPALRPKERKLFAHALFAAVHGIVALGLDEERWGVKIGDVAWQLDALVEAAARA